MRVRSHLLQAHERCGWPALIMFDLDGTLIDSAPDIRAAVNVLLAECGHAALSLPEVRSMIGNGIRKLVERAFAARGEPLAESVLDARAARMMEIYADHLTVETQPMPDALATVASYRAAGVQTAVVTNKPEAFSRAILAALGFGDHIAIVVGGDSCPTRKPEPGMLFHAAEQAAVPVGRCLMVGDSPADIDAARAAGILSVAVRGGYTNVPADDLGASVVIDRLGELPRAIEAIKDLA